VEEKRRLVADKTSARLPLSPVDKALAQGTSILNVQIFELQCAPCPIAASLFSRDL